MTADVEHHGTTVPQGSAILLLNASANRDEGKFVNPDAFDIHPPPMMDPDGVPKAVTR